MTETQERFLRTVLTRVPLDSVVELHLFPPIRRGTMETGMAVIATVLPPAPLTVLEEGVELEMDVSESGTVEGAELEMDVSEPATVEGAEFEMDVSESATVEDAPVHAPRLRILTAAYRHTIKGIDRGKWTVDVQEEADAPLVAVEAVLRGVRQRSTEAADPELVSLETLAALIALVRVAPAA